MLVFSCYPNKDMVKELSEDGNRFTNPQWTKISKGIYLPVKIVKSK